MEEVQGKDNEEQVEVEKEKRVNEGAPWMVWKWLSQDSALEPNEVSDDIKCEKSALYVHAQRTVCTTQLSRSTSSLVSCLVRCLLRMLFHLFRTCSHRSCCVVCVVAILHGIFLYGRCTLYRDRTVTFSSQTSTNVSDDGELSFQVPFNV